ncbi:unnamed protein product [Leuciscus chuanchicus]
MVCPVILTKPCGGGLKGAGVSDAAVCQLCLSRANYHPVFRPDMLYGNRPTTAVRIELRHSTTMSALTADARGCNFTYRE